MAALQHLLVVSAEDAADPKAWSGIPYSLLGALRSQVPQVSFFRPSPPARNPWDVARRLLHGGKLPHYPLWMTEATLKQNGRQVERQIANLKPDAVLSISSQCIAGVSAAAVPIYMFSDAPWQVWMETYIPEPERPVRWRQFAAAEAAAARRIAGLFFGSEWAVTEGTRVYAGADASPSGIRAKSHVTPLGANYVPAAAAAEVINLAAARPRDRLDLLFLGRDWERKGGPLAVETTRLLRESGTNARLHIVGCRPDLPTDAADSVTMHGLLRRDVPEQASALQQLLSDSHFQLVPTTAECFGISFAEAQAFAMPPVSRAVHALPTVVEDGVTGILLPPDAGAERYRDRILDVWRSPDAYLRMARNGRKRFEQTLNWQSCARAMVEAMSGDLT